MNARYVVIAKADIPPGVRFDIPRRNQGQIIEIAYGGFSRAEHDDGDPYMSIRDWGIGPDAVHYYRLVKVS